MTYNSTTFLDYAGNQIKGKTGPYLKYSGTIGTTGNYAPKIMWQDVNGLVSSVSVAETTTENGYLKFYIAPNKIAEGNAVIAVRDGSGKIMWSWHIWVTAIDIYNTIPVTAYNGTTIYNFMQVNLGWCNIGNISTFPSRNVIVKLKQATSNETTTINISQNPHNIASTSGNHPFYEWGRKDPLTPGIGTSLDYKTVYSGSFTHTQANPTIQQTIQNPSTYYYGDNSGTLWIWYDTGYYDLWNAGNKTASGSYTSSNTTTTQKSIYDPCPVGFCVPPTYAFSGFSSSGDGATITHSSNRRYVSSFSYNKGCYFYTNNSYNKQIFIPATGIHDYKGTTLVVGDATNTGMSSTYAVNCVYRSDCAATCPFKLTTTACAVMGSHATCWGFSVRPIAE